MIDDVVKKLKEAMTQESKRTEEARRESDDKRKIIIEAQTAIETAKQEEAWTAQQTIIQIQAANQRNEQEEKAKLIHLEEHAEKLIADTANTASREKNDKEQILVQARLNHEQKQSTISEQKTRIETLKEMLVNAQKEMAIMRERGPIIALFK